MLQVPLMQINVSIRRLLSENFIKLWPSSCCPTEGCLSAWGCGRERRMLLSPGECCLYFFDMKHIFLTAVFRDKLVRFYLINVRSRCICPDNLFHQ